MTTFYFSIIVGLKDPAQIDKNEIDTKNFATASLKCDEHAQDLPIKVLRRVNEALRDLLDNQ